MVTESICLDIVLALYGNTTTTTRSFNVDAVADAPDASPKVQKSEDENSLLPAHLYRQLLPFYSLATIEDNIKWLEFTGLLGWVRFGLGGIKLYQLTPAGVEFARSRNLDEENRKLLYTEDPYSVFIARQFGTADEALYSELAERLSSAGFSALDGTVDGLAAFRGEILRKIRKARFFICLLTHRFELQAGGFASSVWLYQETGAAVALGKMPLVLVEADMHDHYAGELQRNYEYVSFDRPRFGEALPQVVRRLHGDLSANHIPLPKCATT